MEMFMQLLQQYHGGGEAFLQWIVTSIETWVHHCEPVSIEWEHISLPRTEKFKSVPPVSKVMLLLFWDCNGHILEHYKDHGQMGNSEWYYAMFEEELKPLFIINTGMLRNDVGFRVST
jgi:hypothetical protein